MKNYIEDIRTAWKMRDWPDLLELLILEPVAWLFDSSDERVPPATVVLDLAIVIVLVKLLRAYL